MIANGQRYTLFNSAALLLFFLFGYIAINENNASWLAIPFALAISPLLFKWIVASTEHLFWIVLVLLPLSTELNITPSLGLDFPDEVFLLLLTAVGIVKLIHQPTLFYPVLKSPLLLLIVLQLCWIVFTCFFSTEPLLSIKFLLAKIWYIVPFVLLAPIIVNNKSKLKLVAICLCIPMLLVVAQTLIRHSFYGFEFALIKKTLFPFFRNHVNYSSMLVCLIPIGWGIWYFTVNGSRKKWIMIGLFIALLALIFAYSRGAWVAGIVGLITAWGIQKKWMLQISILAIALVSIFSIAIISNNRYLQFAPEHNQTIFHSNFKEHLRATITLKDISNAERFHRWVAGANMIAEKPIIGFGPNSFYNQYKPYTVSSFKTWVSNNPEHSTVHNYYLLTAIEQGIPGLLLLLLLWISMVVAAQKLYHTFQSEFYSKIALITGIVIGMIASINFTSDMIETDKIGGLFWLSIGVLITLQIKQKEEASNIARN
ncbi:MAG: O-antigen polymerase [Chitinophagaceae bacterium]|nr:MAG: O-antigen [Chitinophagaceae bacterium]TXT32516.1 MAG: O-antigen polymerase [Chitinophagaceae bacterium]